ncbi:MAG: 3-deoxy-D-manno-octulosonic acid transferase [Verrucomicrobia bacterium]|nr:3-deoxy-D-manno-octulosonic acid transferase [Verrucomicrobiota bacterium]
MRLVYNILFILGFLVTSPFYFLKMWRRGNWRKGFAQRFGYYDRHVQQALTNRQIVWVHAVSVGEVNLSAQLVAALEPSLPSAKFVVSTTTSTGMAELRRKLPLHVTKVYYPVDGSGCVRRALRLVPEAVILIEAEIWPNFLWRLADRGTPVFLANARLSERSFRGYRRMGFLFRPLFAAFAGIGAQNEGDAARLRELGCDSGRVHVTGNLKFDTAVMDARQPQFVPTLLNKLCVPAGAPIIVAGSTHAGEEALLAEIFPRLKAKHPELFLVLVPRHQERAPDVSRELDALGLRHALRTEVNNGDYAPGDVDCLLVNTTGELKNFYAAAAVVFVGKSLTAEGGQNPIEPGLQGKAMVFGPNMQNFAPIAEALVQRQGAVQVADAKGLEATLDELLGDAAKRDQLGRNALAVVRQNQGALDRTVEMILKGLEGGRLYVAPPAV